MPSITDTIAPGSGKLEYFNFFTLKPEIFLPLKNIIQPFLKPNFVVG